jgi:hypothetical protein
MRARHKKALGGRSSEPDGEEVTYAGKGSHVEKEAKEKNRGGKAVGKMHGGAAKHRLDKRARGGRTGSDKSPFASSTHTTPSKSMKEPQGA